MAGWQYLLAAKSSQTSKSHNIRADEEEEEESQCR
jgi:hypothetical protein